MNLVQSSLMLEFDFHVIGITEHKIHKNDVKSTTNITLEGSHPFLFDATGTSHGGTGFYIMNL